MISPKSTAVMVAALFTVSLSLRLALAFNGGIWADEAFVLNVLNIPETSELVHFLSRRESHPPLFYLLLRAWTVVAGSASDASLLVFLCTLGALIVPATFFVGRSLFSRQTGLVAATLVAVSPSLIDHGSQIRPYGILPLLILGSVYLLVRSLDGGRTLTRVAWAIVTAGMLYTHNWAWLVLGGELVAAAIVLRRQRLIRSIEAAALIAPSTMLAVLMLPWMPSLLYQIAHAGHTGPPIYSAADWIIYVTLGLATIPYHLLFGLYPPRLLPLVALAGITSLLFLLAASARGRFGRCRREPAETETRAATVSLATLILIIVPAAALLVAAVMSPRSNLLLARCVACLAPLALLLTAHALAKTGLFVSDKQTAQSAGIVFLVTLFLANVWVLLPTQRSNVRDVASRVREAARNDDLLIIAPEWFAPSFNHYFPASIEQYDYPHPGRSGLIDFSNVRERSRDTSALVALRDRIRDARLSNRRTWLISSRRYLDFIDFELAGVDEMKRRNSFTSVMRLKDVRDALIENYGSPDTTHFVRGRIYRHDEIVPLLFTPRRPASPEPH
jgi:mannosyltransferase